MAGVGATDESQVSALRLHTVLMSDAAADQLRADQSVARVETEETRAATAVPSDTEYGSQWALPQIGWDQVFGSVAPGGSATVALLDTGVDATHPDLAGNIVPGASILEPARNGTADPNGHGTAMAGIVAASTDNGEGIAGVGYAGVNVMPVTVLDGRGVGQDGDIIGGVVWAADHGADVILMPFSSPDFSPSLQEAIDYAWSQGAVLVAADRQRRLVGSTLPGWRPGCCGRRQHGRRRRPQHDLELRPGGLHGRARHRDPHDGRRRRLHDHQRHLGLGGCGRRRGRADQGQFTRRLERRGRGPAGAERGRDPGWRHRQRPSEPRARVDRCRDRPGQA